MSRAVKENGLYWLFSAGKEILAPTARHHFCTLCLRIPQLSGHEAKQESWRFRGGALLPGQIRPGCPALLPDHHRPRDPRHRVLVGRFRRAQQPGPECKRRTQLFATWGNLANAREYSGSAEFRLQALRWACARAGRFLEEVEAGFDTVGDLYCACKFRAAPSALLRAGLGESAVAKHLPS